MKWQIPGKSFLIGEYAALAGEGAILLTTNPSFEIHLKTFGDSLDIHPDSPAGRLLNAQGISECPIEWKDPYFSQGGLGASTAQFIGAYLAGCYINGIQPNFSDMLESYYYHAWSGKGLMPSAYDLMAQTLQGCVYINKSSHSITTQQWPFSDIGFVLVHTGKKLATHHHLQTATLPSNLNTLKRLVIQSKQAFDTGDSHILIEAVNEYHQELLKSDLVAKHSLAHINILKENSNILAVKGCGAMGSDILLILYRKEGSKYVSEQLLQSSLQILANDTDLYKGKPSFDRVFV